MDVLVTGGGGLLGRHLVAALLERGDEDAERMKQRLIAGEPKHQSR